MSEYDVPYSETANVINGILRLPEPPPAMQKCPHCSKSFKASEATKLSIIRHMVKEHKKAAPEVMHVCRFCDFCPNPTAVYAKKVVKAHVQKEHANYTTEPMQRHDHECTICNATFPSSQSLGQHKRVHNSQKNEPIREQLREITGQNKRMTRANSTLRNDTTNADSSRSQSNKNLSPVHSTNGQQSEASRHKETSMRVHSTGSLSPPHLVSTHQTRSPPKADLTTDYSATDIMAVIIDKVLPLKPSTALLDIGCFTLHDDSYTVLTKYSALPVIPRSLTSSFSTLIIPMMPSLGHWSLAVLHRSSHTIMYIDSLGIPLPLKARTHLHNIANHLGIRDLIIKETKQHEFTKQWDTVSCGKFVALFAERHLTRQSFFFSHAEFAGYCHSVEQCRIEGPESIPCESDVIIDAPVNVESTEHMLEEIQNAAHLFTDNNRTDKVARLEGNTPMTAGNGHMLTTPTQRAPSRTPPTHSQSSFHSARSGNCSALEPNASPDLSDLVAFPSLDSSMVSSAKTHSGHISSSGKRTSTPDSLLSVTASPDSSLGNSPYNPKSPTPSILSQCAIDNATVDLNSNLLSPLSPADSTQDRTVVTTNSPKPINTPQVVGSKLFDNTEPLIENLVTVFPADPTCSKVYHHTDSLLDWLASKGDWASFETIVDDYSSAICNKKGRQKGANKNQPTTAIRTKAPGEPNTQTSPSEPTPKTREVGTQVKGRDIDGRRNNQGQNKYNKSQGNKTNHEQKAKPNTNKNDKQNYNKHDNQTNRNHTFSKNEREVRSRVQSQYLSNKKKAMKTILEPVSPKFPIPVNEAARQLQQSMQHPATDWDAFELNCHASNTLSQSETDSFTAPIDEHEVSRILRSMPNSSPGPDGIEYRQIRRFEGSIQVLTTIYNICREWRKIPTNWKQANITMIYKGKGPKNDIQNWRPISVMQTMYKLYTAIWARRLQRLCSMRKTNNSATQELLTSTEQVGFEKSEGCSEHVFTLRSIINHSRTHKNQLSLMWLDLKNAFGSVPHEVIQAMLTKLGLPGLFNEIVNDLYTNAVSTIKVGQSRSQPIPISAGVKQGDPLSPLLFNLVLEFVIRGVKAVHPDTGYKIADLEPYNLLAYADDLALIADSDTALQQKASTAERLAGICGLEFKPTKCASLSTKGEHTYRTQFAIADQPVKALARGESYIYLGIATGVDADTTPKITLINSTKDVVKIRDCPLAPWQKLDAIKTFIIPRLSYNNFNGDSRKEDLNAFDSAVVSVIRNVTRLPENCARSYIHGPTSKGCLGVIKAADDADISVIASVFKLLCSPSPRLRALANELLRDEVKRWLRRNPSEEDLSHFLSGVTTGEFSSYLTAAGGGASNHFKHARKAIIRLRKRVDVTFTFADGQPQIRIGTLSLTAGNRGAVYRKLRLALSEAYYSDLLAHKSQGKTFHEVAQDNASYNFNRDGRKVSYGAYSFIHRARLNLLPCNANILTSHTPRNDPRCRHCGWSYETLPHILNHCVHSASSHILQRHNAVQNRIADAILKEAKKQKSGKQKVVLKVNQVCDVAGRTVRPDIQYIDKVNRTVWLVDIACPFENGDNAFEKARLAKIYHYEQEVQAYEKLGYKCFVDAIIVGSLGSYDRANDGLLRALNVSSTSLRDLKQKLVRDTIEFSKNAYWSHILGDLYVTRTGV